MWHDPSVILLDASSLGASTSTRTLFRDLELTIHQGDRVGIVGMNGSGKSTLLSLLTGAVTPETGTVRVGRGTRIGMVSQTPRLPPGTVLEAAGGDWRAAAALDRLGMADVASSPTDALSGGQTTRVALAALAARDWDLVILDEPTNHLDLDAVDWLTQWLGGLSGGLVLVTHDRHLLDRVTTRIVELDDGEVHHHVARGEHAASGYTAYLEGRAERLRHAEAAGTTRRALARRELAWLRRGAPARTSKSKAHLERAHGVLEPSGKSHSPRPDLELDLGTTRLGSRGIELVDIAYRFPGGSRTGTDDPEGPLVLDGVDHVFEPGDRVGLVGPNGAGKTTLLEIIAGDRLPSRGDVRVGTTVKIARYRQRPDEFDGSLRVRDVVASDLGEPGPELVELMRRFWFDRAAQFAPVATLSGGERRRLQLLMTLARRPNVLLLDEPTNDLDLDTLRALEDFLESWSGILIVVSHDRTLLDRTVDQLLVLDGDGRLERRRGGVAEWIASRSMTRNATSGPSPDTTALRSRSTPPRSAASSSRPTESSRRSPSTLRRLLAERTRETARLETERDEALARLTTTSDHAERERLSIRLAELSTALDSAEEAWLEVATEAEARGLEIASDR